MELRELERLIAVAEADPAKFFGDDIDDVLRDMHVKGHPDRFLSPEDNAIAQEIFQRFGVAADAARKPPVVITIRKRDYRLGKLIASGDVSDIYEAMSGITPFTLKIARVPNVDSMMRNEAEILEKLAKDDFTLKYVPHIVETMRGKDGFVKQITTFRRDPTARYFTLRQIREKYPMGLEGRHLGWLFKRLLEALGGIHKAGIVHGSILLDHVLVFPSSHGISLLDWKTAGPLGNKPTTISATNRNWYPLEVIKKTGVGFGTDIYMAASCIVRMGYGDAPSSPSSVPRQMATFLQSCLMEKLTMRPPDAWALHDEFTELLLGLYGKPRFVELTM